MPLLRSAFSDPIQSGINAFRGVSDVLNQQESLKLRRELMDREKAQSDLMMEREKQGMQAQQENMTWNKQVRERMGMEWAREDDLRNFNAAVSKLDTGQDLEDSDYDSILKATHGMDNWKNMKPEQWTEVHNNLRSLKTGIDQIWPQIAESWGKGQGVYLNRAQAPELFSAFDKIPSYGGQVNKGKDRHGQTEGVEKSLERIYFDPRNGTMVPLLRVKDSKGDTYEAPMTFDRGNDPNAPIVQLPVQLFNAHLNAQLKMADWADTVRMKLGDKETAKRYESQKETLRQNEVWLAGEDSVQDLLTTKPNATANELRNAFKKSVREKAKEKGIAISEKDITNEAARISEKQAAVPKVQNIQIGDKNVPHVWNPEKGTLEPVGEGGPKFKPDKAPEWKPGERELKEREVTTKEEAQKNKAKELTEKKIERELKEKEKPLSIPEQKEITNEASRRDLDEEDDADIIGRATEIKQADKKLTIKQAFDKAVKEIGKRPDVGAVSKEMSGKPKGKYKVEGHMGTWDGKAFKWITE